MNAAELSAASNAFAVDLHRALPREGNLFVSPYVLHLALRALREGAAGETQRELDHLLHLSGSERAPHRPRSSSSCEVCVAQRLFVAGSVRLREAYAQRLARDFDAAPEVLDFAGAPDTSREHINRWVAEHTADRIRELVGPYDVSEDTKLVCVSAIYFKAEWSFPFEPFRTQPGPFTLPSGEVVSVPMMHMPDSRQRVLFCPEVQILEMTYRDSAIVLDVLLPPPSRSLAELEASLELGRLQSWLDALRAQQVDVVIPRLSLDPAPQRLRRTLEQLGARSAFDPRRADFSSLAEGTLALEQVLHKAFIRLTEEGTEAGAATAILAILGLPEEAPRFVVDRPFLILLRDRRDGSFLFLGRVTDARAEPEGGD